MKNGWNDFVRIEIALKLEPSYQRDALANQQAGGRHKGSAILPKALQIDVRKKIAKEARVCPRNVSKVKQILKCAHPRLIEALREGVISINRAAKLCDLSKADQINELSQYLSQRQTSKAVRQAISRRVPVHNRLDTMSVLSSLLRQEAQQPGSIKVRMSRAAQTIIVLGQDFPTRSPSEEELKRS